MPPKVEKCVQSFMDSPRNKKKWPDADKRKQAAFAICNAQVKNSDVPMGFIVDMQGTKFDEGSKTVAVQALPLGKYYHPLHGDIEITPERVARFVDNVNNNVRETQLDIDYSHKDSVEGDKAAGWVVNAENRGDDGLWLNIEFTPPAQTALANKEWRYFSSEYLDEWCHPKSGECYQDVLLGGALTNRPFIKDIAAINFDEYFALPTGKFPQDEAHLRPALDSMRRCGNCAYWRDGSCLVVDGEIQADQVSDYFMPIYNDQADSMMYAMEEEKAAKHLEEVKMNELLKKLATLFGVDIEEGEGKEEANAEKVFAEASKKLKELETKPAPKPEETKAKAFAEQFPEEAKLLAEQTLRLKEAEVSTKLKDWMRNDEHKRGIAPVVLEETIRPYRLTLDGEDANKFDAIMTEIIAKGLVDFTERGRTSAEDNTHDDKDRFLAEVKKFQEENKGVSFSDATRQVSRLQPELADAYRKTAKEGSESA